MSDKVAVSEIMESINFMQEAEWTKNEIGNYVDFVEISNILPKSLSCVFINLRTKERTEWCVRLSSEGYRIVGDGFDRMNKESENLIYETVFSLMDHISPNYRASFNDELSQRLKGLQSD